MMNLWAGSGKQQTSLTGSNRNQKLKFGFVKGIFRQQIENQKTRKCLKDVFRRVGQGILIPFHELRKITEPGNQLKAGFAAG